MPKRDYSKAKRARIADLRGRIEYWQNEIVLAEAEIDELTMAIWGDHAE